MLSIIFEKQKQKIGETIKNNYSTTKAYRKPKHYWHKISYYETPKNFSQLIQEYNAS